MASCISPGKDCDLCPRLAGFRVANRKQFPGMFNAPVPAFGDADPLLLIVGLAPGLRGANFTGRPFTGDYAGDTLYPMLAEYGFAKGDYNKHINDGLALIDARITNAVRCVPPENKPGGEEINNCRPFLESELTSLKRLKVIIALGTVAHNSILRAVGLPVAGYKFGHNVKHILKPKKALGHTVTLLDSYHCSRYNVNTGRLTEKMFADVIRTARDEARKGKAA